ncbi:hypothetical protein DSO57_1014512 [Entomophthora muscae]|uniref:Uncharacterized protein n=1 Tax=Entomophthora muscae TaxID=34485 RepID=A0ACC2T5S3_9FUNG|nr:hypothetical protein DSO57_1014512 [Entomophthora muscae]
MDPSVEDERDLGNFKVDGFRCKRFAVQNLLHMFSPRVDQNYNHGCNFSCQPSSTIRYPDTIQTHPLSEPRWLP